MSENQIQIPVELTETLVFDDAFTSMKERFVAEMKRIDEAMVKFSNRFLQSQTARIDSNTSSPDPHADLLTNSPLVEGEGENKILKLQFDVSQFNPEEVTVSMLQNKLMISAAHKESTDTSTSLREYRREFYFPQGVDPANITSSLSKDGVLIVQAPLAITDNATPK
ncbi:heat shock protein 30D-like [Danaus plexippus]|uniref:heat shock protein 30D-like n=1 Tax=Danaus plexippus TaxID=13037 RepID=UPI002AB13D95|nr:heat shock protein 30D-like [Danaus plexippus]